MRAVLGSLARRGSDSIYTRPLAFVALGLALGVVLLRVDALAGPGLLPDWLHFDAGLARVLLSTLAGATLTIAGITFWVRAAAVQMAAGQFTPRVVQGFLHDWFQQSMMGLLLGIFAYQVVVLRAVPARGDSPHVSVLAGVLLAGCSVLAVLGAIRNGVESMQAGELARRITDDTIERIRKHHPARAPRRDARLARDVPEEPGHLVRAAASGWVHSIDEERLLDGLGAGTVVRIEVRVGLFVRQGRALCTIWSDDGVWLDTDARVRQAIRLGRSRAQRNDIHYGLQQLADIARGSLTHGTADPAAAGEAIAHLEMVLRELLARDLPPVAFVDDDRQVIRRRDYAIEDYLAVAFDELRLAAAPHPSVVIALLDTIGALLTEVRGSGRPERADPLRLQGRLVLDASEQAGLPEGDLAHIRRAAGRHGLAAPAGP